MKILVINGPNINMLGIREPEIYGKKDYNALIDFIKASSEKENIEVECFQSNHEGDIVDKIQLSYNNFDGIIINPAAYTHTSVAILDALSAVALPAVEVHLSDISLREKFRQTSFCQKACLTTFKGLGFEGYRQALLYLKKYLKEK